MTRPDAERVGDIRRASAVAAEVARLGEEAFDDSLLLQFAAERAIGIIGEAAARLAESPDFVAAHPTARLGEAAGMRNLGSAGSDGAGLSRASVSEQPEDVLHHQHEVEPVGG